MLQLSFNMAQSGYWGFKEVSLMEAWVLDLVASGYTPPVLLPVRRGHLHGAQQYAPPALPSSPPPSALATPAREDPMLKLLTVSGYEAAFKP